MQIETVTLDSLTADPNNARKHDKRNIDAIAHSLEQFGQRKPIVATHDGVVIAGNGTLEAARKIGWTAISIARAPEGWDEATVRAYALADNQTGALAEWDEAVLNGTLAELAEDGWDITALGFDEIPEPTVLSMEDAFGALPDGERANITQMTFTMTLEQSETVKDALARCKTLNGFDLDTGNSNSNGNALAFIAQDFIRGLG